VRPRSLAGELEVRPGYELALATVLGGRLGAAIVDDLPAAEQVLDRAGRDGGRALVAGVGGASDSPAGAPPAAHPPVPGAEPLAPSSLDRPARSPWLAGCWPARGSWTTSPPCRPGSPASRSPRWARLLRSGGEVRQAASGGSERVLAERNRRDALVRSSEEAVRAEQAALAAVESAAGAVAGADVAREEADQGARAAERHRAAAQEAERQAAWLLEQRRAAPDQGPGAVRRAQLEGELAAERRMAERAARERAERAARIERLEAAVARDRALRPLAERVAAALERALAAVLAQAEVLEAELAADRRTGKASPPSCARVRRRRPTCSASCASGPRPSRSPRSAPSRRATRRPRPRRSWPTSPGSWAWRPSRARIRCSHRTPRPCTSGSSAWPGAVSSSGPVNPLAQAEYDEALAHVEELERQRTDLETALRELRVLLRDTDRVIRQTFEETFAAAASNFAELAEMLFPGGRGRLRLVREDTGPRPVLGGADADASGDEAEAEAVRALRRRR
jgi:chromosome segregation protein